ncbi:UDP-N-acetylmuramoyl-tripeptide--D-alanyl-D-alanine ligase [Streptomyces sp. NPDC050804]|uniref:UDP-N-acetylmuramoyl-tripeptide--D-alanyl-D- alanine ligase n=1 Tax=Streptomyces sp. NPDC050804 TaxID=3154745 RepID=UPI003448F3FA
MIPLLTLAEITEATAGTLHHVTDPAAQVTGPLSFDSRNIAPGGLFACLTGRTFDGHDFAEQVVRDGAVAVIATRPTSVPTLLVPDVLNAMGDIARAVAARYTGTVIALTGSAGKTSTKDILENVLALDGPTVANEKSFNNEIGFPVTVSRVMPDSRYLLLEMGARGKGHIEKLCGLVRPAIATVLGVGSAHIGEFGSTQAIADAKAEIVRALPRHGIAVLNGDDALVAAMAQQTEARVITFGTAAGCDVEAVDITVEHGRPTFTLRHGTGEARVALRVHGRHNTINALAAAATAIAAGVPFPRIVSGLQEAGLSSGGRMEILERPDGITIINDAFNASPESVIAALTALSDIAGTERRKIAVLGEMAELGPETEAWHDKIATEVLASGIALTIGIGGEHATRLTTAVREGGANATKTDRSPSLPQHINAMLRPGDVVLIKGANALGLEQTARELADMLTAENEE